MVYAFNPIADPIGFMIAYFLSNFLTETFLIPIKLGFMASVLIFPFAVIGKYIHEKFTVLQMKKSNSLIQVLVTTVIMTIVFWLGMRIWYFIFNPAAGGLFAGSFFDFLKSIIFAIIIAFLFVLLARRVYWEIQERWETPEMFTIYVVELLMCMIGWSIISVWFYITMIT